MNRVRCQFAALVGWLLLPMVVLAQDQISFWHLRIEGGKIEFLENTVVDGRLKPERKRSFLEFEVLDGAGDLLHRGGVEDAERIEFPDGEDGKIGTLTAERAVREFVVRAPRNDRARTLRWYRSSSDHAGLQTLDTGRISLGDVVIPPIGNRVRAQATGVSKLLTLITNGPTVNRLNVVLLADGFQAHQEQLFTNRAASVLNRFLDTSPYRSYRSYFNGFAIFVPSNESGADHPSRNVFRDTYFSSTFESYGIDRLLTIPPNDRNPNFSEGRGRVFALLEKHLPEYDIVMMLVNDTDYGGSGGIPAIASLDSSSADIAIHEVGHSFAALGDEYDSPANYPDNEEPNTTRETRRDFIKWRDWILDSTPIPTPETTAFRSVVGLFEGAHYHATGWYRPKLDCAMKTLGAPFCEVCSEALIVACYERVNLLESIEPLAPSLTSTALDPARMSFRSIEGVGPTVAFDWIIDGNALPNLKSNSLDLAGVYVSTGVHTIAVLATDRTAAVRKDTLGDLVETASWVVTVQSTREPVVTAATTQIDPGKLDFRFTSNLRATLVLETSADLLTWIPVVTNTAVSQIDLAVEGGSEPREFLRAKALPAF